MELPRVGEFIDTERARELCAFFGLHYLVERIDKSTHDAFKTWKFDGASMVPDDLFARIAQIPSLVVIALKHDLKYAYGEPGNQREKERADREFKADLLADGAASVTAEVMYQAVRAFGNMPRASFAWGFARRA